MALIDLFVTADGGGNLQVLDADSNDAEFISLNVTGDPTRRIRWTLLPPVEGRRLTIRFQDVELFGQQALKGDGGETLPVQPEIIDGTAGVFDSVSQIPPGKNPADSGLSVTDPGLEFRDYKYSVEVDGFSLFDPFVRVIRRRHV